MPCTYTEMCLFLKLIKFSLYFHFHYILQCWVVSPYTSRPLHRSMRWTRNRSPHCKCFHTSYHPPRWTFSIFVFHFIFRLIFVWFSFNFSCRFSFHFSFGFRLIFVWLSYNLSFYFSFHFCITGNISQYQTLWITVALNRFQSLF